MKTQITTKDIVENTVDKINEYFKTHKPYCNMDSKVTDVIYSETEVVIYYSVNGFSRSFFIPIEADLTSNDTSDCSDPNYFYFSIWELNQIVPSSVTPRTKVEYQRLLAEAIKYAKKL